MLKTAERAVVLDRENGKRKRGFSAETPVVNENGNRPDVRLTINGQALDASAGMALIEAAWNAGLPGITGGGCLEGVCGSCRVMLRRGENVTLGLACQTFVENGLEVIFLPPPSAPRHQYSIADLKDSWDIHARFHAIFPEASSCRHCHGCVNSCPKGIAVEDGVALAAAGRYREAGEVFLECVMCELCVSACPELIGPCHVGLFCRRVTARFQPRPPNLVARLEELRRKRAGTAKDEKNEG